MISEREGLITSSLSTTPVAIMEGLAASGIKSLRTTGSNHWVIYLLFPYPTCLSLQFQVKFRKLIDPSY